jgi:hypothetical protein
VGEAADRGFQRGPGDPADFDLEELDEIFRPDPARPNAARPNPVRQT